MSEPHVARGLSRHAALERLARLPGWVVLLVGLLATAVLSLVDYFTGSELSFSIFYLAPVLLVTWFAGRPLGSVTAVIAAVVWGVVDVAAGARYSAPLIPVWNALVRLGFFVIALWLLGEMQSAHRVVRELALTDSLTGAANARSFYTELEHEIERLRRYGRPFALAYADLDHFKDVNDALGHAGGDELLRRVAAALSSATRGSDMVARLGGDEFAILMPETDHEAAAMALGRARDRVAALLGEMAGAVPGVGVTVGAAVFVTPPESPDAAVAVADSAMYEGKQSGRGVLNLLVHEDAGAAREGVDAT